MISQRAAPRVLSSRAQVKRHLTLRHTCHRAIQLGNLRQSKSSRLPPCALVRCREANSCPAPSLTSFDVSRSPSSLLLRKGNACGYNVCCNTCGRSRLSGPSGSACGGQVKLDWDGPFCRLSAILLCRTFAFATHLGCHLPACCMSAGGSTCWDRQWGSQRHIAGAARCLFQSAWQEIYSEGSVIPEVRFPR